MKHLLATFLVLTLASNTQAQTFAEWFNQNSTQRKYLLQQIATLKVYSGYLKKGYSIAKDGTHLIGNIKNGDLGLHAAYFNSLKTVNPAIKKDSRITAILSMQAAMSSQRQSIARVASDSKMFSSAELNNITGILNKLSEQASQDLDELELVITDGKLQMTDDERIKAIGKLYGLTQDKYSYLKRLGLNITALAAARQQGIKDAALQQSLYGTGN